MEDGELDLFEIAFILRNTDYLTFRSRKRMGLEAGIPLAKLNISNAKELMPKLNPIVLFIFFFRPLFRMTTQISIWILL